MIIFSNTVPQPAVNPFYRDCSEIESAAVFLMIYSLIQFRSFCNPYKLANKWSSVLSWFNAARKWPGVTRSAAH